jgi:MFS family permease
MIGITRELGLPTVPSSRPATQGKGALLANASTNDEGRSLSLWRHRDFMKLWSAESISQLGTQVTFLALPLTAILLLDATPFQLGVLTAVEFAPFLLIGLPAGVWVDRLPRRPILISGDVGRAVALATIPIAAAFDVLTMIQLVVVAFIVGICTVFFDVAYQSFLPSLVDRPRLTEGNAKLEISRSAAQLAGPGLAGILVELVRAPFAVLIDAISYAGSALFIWRIRVEEQPPEDADRESGAMRRQIGEGLRYVLRHPLLRPIAAATSISNLFFSMIMAILVLFAVRSLDMSPGRLGLAFAIGNSGLLVGAFLSQRVARSIGVGWAIIASMALFAVVTFGYPLVTASDATWVFIVVGFVNGLATVIYNVNQVSLRQAITPQGMLGRMNATMRFVVWGTMPLGALIGGALGNSIGLRPTLWIAAIGNAFAVLPPLLSPVRRLREIPDTHPDPTVFDVVRPGAPQFDPIADIEGPR